MSTNRRPFLYDRHVELGAKIVPFGGWEMPLQYGTGTVAEHLATRSDATVFDVSHLGTVRCGGDAAFDELQEAFTNDLRKIAPGRAQYTHLLNEAGGVIDDIIVWWINDKQFDVMPNASNTSGVLSAVTGTDVTAERCVLAVQGPRARERVATFAPTWAAVGRFHVIVESFNGVEVRVAGTGYTGEDGIEIACPNEVSSQILDKLLEAGVQPAGLGARDTLRLEAALPLHGHELSASISPLEAKLGWVIGWDKSTFRGREALATQRASGVARFLHGFATSSRQPLREDGEISRDGVVLGRLTSGNFSPTLGHGIGMGFTSEPLELGSVVDVVLRGRSVEATVTSLPFVRKAV